MTKHRVASIIGAAAFTLGLIGSPYVTTAQASTTSELNSEGHWVSYDGQSIDQSTGSPNSIKPQIQVSCPAGTTNYTGAAAPYSCLHVDKTLSGHLVGIRQGRSGSSGFGLLHADIDHNVDDRQIELLLQDTNGYNQGNNRYKYGQTFKYNNNSVVSLEVIETRAPSASSPDDKYLGLQTAYCRAGSRTAPVEDCPDDLPPPFNK